MELDVKDKKVLSILDVSARTPASEIGKQAGLSKETTIYRLKRLEQRGIVKRYVTLVNIANLGYTGFAVYARFEKINERTRREIIAYLKDMPELYWIALVGGRFDLVFAIMCRSVFEFNRLYYRILNKFGEQLTDTTISMRTELQQNRRGYLLDKQGDLSKAPYFGKEPALEQLDESDSRILSMLSNNARMSVVTLSKMLEIPISTISARIKGMERRGVIQGYSAYIRAQEYGMQSYRLFLYLQKMDESARKRLFAYAQENPNMILAIETVGEWNFEITLEVESHKDLQKEMTKLRDQFSENIKKLEFIIMFEDDLVYDPYPLRKKERK
jgi:Lrp/AsnC family leucine-responsive transcriptional regulator